MWYCGRIYMQVFISIFYYFHLFKKNNRRSHVRKNFLNHRNRSIPTVKSSYHRQDMVSKTMSFFKFIGCITCRPTTRRSPETFGFILSHSVSGTSVLIKTDARYHSYFCLHKNKIKT